MWQQQGHLTGATLPTPLPLTNYDKLWQRSAAKQDSCSSVTGVISVTGTPLLIRTRSSFDTRTNRTQNMPHTLESSDTIIVNIHPVGLKKTTSSIRTGWRLKYQDFLPAYSKGSSEITQPFQ